MKQNESFPVVDEAYYRIITLWVLAEAFAGGLFHAIKLPGSGMIVSGAAVVCICLIGKYKNSFGSILKATVIVAIFKLMLSPHSPATAYLAVFFQGFLGELLFCTRRFYRLSCILLGTFALG